MRWSQLTPRPGASTHPVGDTKGFGVWRGRYIVSVGVIGRSRALLYPGMQFGPIARDSLLKCSSLNNSCSPPLPGWGPNNTYPNGTETHLYA